MNRINEGLRISPDRNTLIVQFRPTPISRGIFISFIVCIAAILSIFFIDKSISSYTAPFGVFFFCIGILTVISRIIQWFVFRELKIDGKHQTIRVIRKLWFVELQELCQIHYSSDNIFAFRVIHRPRGRKEFVITYKGEDVVNLGGSKKVELLIPYLNDFLKMDDQPGFDV